MGLTRVEEYCSDELQTKILEAYHTKKKGFALIARWVNHLGVLDIDEDHIRKFIFSMRKRNI